MKFAKADEKYLAVRKELSEKYGPRELWSVADHWQLYAGIGNLARSLAIADLVKSTLDVPGHIAEFGSWRGSNLLYMTKLLRIWDPHGCKQVHCFDGFLGLSTFTAEDAHATDQAGAYKGSLEEMEDVIALYEMQDDIEIHQGLVQDTLVPLLAQRTELSFSLVYVDVDLYEPTKLILDRMHERLQIGGIFVLDEWNYQSYPGETVAVRDFLAEHGEAYQSEHVRGARQPSLVLRKLR